MQFADCQGCWFILTAGRWSWKLKPAETGVTHWFDAFIAWPPWIIFVAGCIWDATSTAQAKSQQIVVCTTLDTYNTRMQKVINNGRRPVEKRKERTFGLLSAQQYSTVINLAIHHAQRSLRWDSNLEAFSCSPTSNSFTTIAFQLIVCTKHLNEVFLSYWLRLLMHCNNQ